MLARLCEELHLLEKELSAYKSFAQDMAKWLEELYKLGFSNGAMFQEQIENKIKELREIAEDKT